MDDSKYRQTGRTFRMILRVLLLASENADNNLTVVSHGRGACGEIIRRMVKILSQDDVEFTFDIATSKIKIIGGGSVRIIDPGVFKAKGFKGAMELVFIDKR